MFVLLCQTWFPNNKRQLSTQLQSLKFNLGSSAIHFCAEFENLIQWRWNRYENWVSRRSISASPTTSNNFFFKFNLSSSIPVHPQSNFVQNLKILQHEKCNLYEDWCKLGSFSTFPMFFPTQKLMSEANMNDIFDFLIEILSFSVFFGVIICVFKLQYVFCIGCASVVREFCVWFASVQHVVCTLIILVIYNHNLKKWGFGRKKCFFLPRKLGVFCPKCIDKVFSIRI